MPLIDRDGMMKPMLLACPSFVPTWERFLQQWRAPDGTRDLPLYLALSELADHLIAKLERGETDDFSAVFAVIERWHREGTRYVKVAATVGLLEDLQNVNRHGASSPSAFLPWLGPETARWWHKVDRFWSHGEPLRDD